MHLALRAALAGTVILLSACGGGGGGGDGTAGGGDAPPSQGTTLSGTVAVGAPLTRADVKAWCSDGSAGPSATTDDDGRYEMQLPAGCTAPWFMQARGSGAGDPTLHAFGDDPTADGPKKTLNITPLSDLFVQVLVDTGDINRAVEAMNKIETSVIDRLWTDILTKAHSLDPPQFGVLTIRSLANTEFKPRPGNLIDDLLEAWAARRGTVSPTAMKEQFLKTGGDLASGKPWKTLFTGTSPLVLSGTSCITSGPTPIPDVTATLRMTGDNLEIEMASSVFGGSPRTFSVGSAIRSEFSLEVRGDTPHVRMRAFISGPSGSMLDVWVDGGTPRITLAGNGGSVFATCELATPVRRDTLVAFEPSSRIMSALPATGTSGSCPTFAYELSALGDVRFNGASLPADWLGAAGARYKENMQFRYGGGTAPAYQIELASGGRTIFPYYFEPGPYHVYCP